MTGTLDWRATPIGVEFVGFGGQPLPPFPLMHTADAPVQPAVRLLEELWGRNLIDQSGNRALLPWMSVYELDAYEIGVLGLPKQDPRLGAVVKTDRWITHHDFRIRADIVFDRKRARPLAAHERRGLLFEFPDGRALPRKELAELILLLDMPLPKSAHERGILVANVKKLAARCPQVRLDHFLRNEDYIVPESLGVDVETAGPDEIRLRPAVNDDDVDGRDFRRFVDGPPRRTYTHQLPEMRRRRLVLRPGQKDAIRRLGDNGTLRGADVPAFFDNPEAYLPDEIELDLAEFAERVRGLVPVVYRSQPYIAVDRTKRRGWFDARPGVAVERGNEDADRDGGPGRSASEAEQSHDLTPEEFRELADAAAAAGGRYARFRDGWIEIDPDRARRFLDFCDDNPETDGRRRVDRASVQLVLDVIPNTDALEYVEPDFSSETEVTLELPDYDLPRSLRANLYPHQEVGYRWMRHLHESGCGGLLADDMGLGKTVQLIAFMSHLHDLGALRPALLVVPLSVMVNWQRELQRFAPNIEPALEHRGPGRQKGEDILRLARNEVVVTTYATLRRDQVWLGQIDWTVVACDEAQNVKNPTANVTSAVKGMKASFRLACTGTPVENGLSELWCIMDFAQPGRLGSRREFRDDFERPLVDALDDTVDEQGHVARLRKRLHPHYIRRTKDQALRLPPKTERTYEVGMSAHQAACYHRILARVQRREANPLGALQNLIAVCSHPLASERTPQAATPEQLLGDAPKLRKTMEVLEEIRRLPAKVVVYTRLKAMQRILQTVIRDRFGFDPRVLNGEVSGPNRHRIVEEFNGGRGFDAMVLSPEAAGVGLNITGATHVIHYTRLWNPAKENQATDRVHRIGQQHPVTIHYPVVVGDGFKSVEQHLHDLLAEKLQLARNVLVARKSLDFMSELERRVTGGAGGGAS